MSRPDWSGPLATELLRQAVAAAPVEITDTWVPGSAQHGEAAPRPRPDEVEAEVAEIFTDAPDLARMAGIRVRLEDDRLVWTTEAGQDFEIEDWAVVPAHEAGPPTVVGGVVRWPTAAATVDVARRKVRIRVSDRARLPFLGDDVSRPDPLWVRDVFRALTHELTEAAARIDRGGRPEPPDQLTPDAAAEQRQFEPDRLSAQDRARLAEIGVLLEAARDPGLGERANQELALLVDNLLGITLTVDPATGALETGRYYLSPLAPDGSRGGDLGSRVAGLNLLISQAAGTLTEPARAWRLIAAAAERRGALAVRVGGTRVVLSAPGGAQVAIHLRPADPVAGAGEPHPAPELAPDGVRVLTLPPAGTAEAELARMVERAVATAVAGMTGAPTGPGLLAAAIPPTGPAAVPVSTADVAVVADLVAAARSYARGAGPTADELRHLVAAARLDVSAPGGELRYLAVLAAGLVPADVATVLDGLTDPRLRRWRERVRAVAQTGVETLGVAEPLGAGLLRVTLRSTDRRVIVQVVPGSPAEAGLVEIAGSLVTVTASPDVRLTGLAEPLAGALVEALLRLPAAPAPGTRPVRPAAGQAVLDEAATLLAADALWLPDGRLRLTGPDGVGRDVPADRVRTLVDGLSRNLADGIDVDRARAAAAMLLGGELAAAAGRPPAGDVLDALGRLAESRPESSAAAAEKAAATLRRQPVPADAHRGLSVPARRLLHPSGTGTAAAGDPYAALRPGRHAAAARAVVDAALAVAAAVHGPGGVDEAGTTLASEVAGLVGHFDRARAALRERSDAHRTGARLARDDARAAGTARKAAARAAQAGDRQGRTRERAQRAEAEVARQAAGRHRRIAAAYAEAAGLAAEAARRYQELAAALTELTTQLAADPTAAAASGLDHRVVLAARTAAQAYGRHESALRRALPPDRALVAGMPTGRLPDVDRLAAALNDELARRGRPDRLTADELDRELRGRWPRLAGADGVVLRVGSGATPAELRVRLTLADPVELLERLVRHSESISGHFPQGGRTVSVAVNRFRTGGLGGPVADFLRPYTEALADTVPWQAAAKLLGRHLVLDLAGRLGFRSSRVASSAGLALGGAVDDNRGEATFFDVAARWEVDLGPTPAGWTPVGSAEPANGSGHRPASVRLKVPHPYTEPAPPDTTSLFPPGEVPPERPLPEHWATDVRGVQRLADRVAAELGPLAPPGSPVRRQLDVLLTGQLPARLETAVNSEHGLPPAPLTDRGQLVAVVQVKSRVVRRPAGSVRMVGTASTKQHLERLRIGFSQAMSAVGRTVEWGGNVVTGVQATPEGGGRAARKADRGRSLPRQTRVGATSIRPSVRRWAGHTQAYVLELEHTVTVQVVDEQAPRAAITERGEALVRMAEPDAYRYGLPVDAAAVGRDHRGAVRLRDDPDPGRPPGRRKSLPRWLGPDGLRGAGPATVRNLTGADEARAEVIARLQELGWVPALDGTGFPILSSDRMEAKSQLQNLAEVTERLSTAGLETGYDQARQDGMIVDLVLERSNRSPLHWPLRVRLVPTRPGHYRGHLAAEVPVNLHIAAESWGRSQSQSFQRSRTADAGTETVYDPLDAGLGQRAGLGGRRPRTGPDRDLVGGRQRQPGRPGRVGRSGGGLRGAASADRGGVPPGRVAPAGGGPPRLGRGAAPGRPAGRARPGRAGDAPGGDGRLRAIPHPAAGPRAVAARGPRSRAGHDPRRAPADRGGGPGPRRPVRRRPQRRGPSRARRAAVRDGLRGARPVAAAGVGVGVAAGGATRAAWVGVTALVTGHINMTQVGFGLSQDWQQALSGTLTIGTGGPDGSATGSGSVSAGTSRRQATAYGLESLAVNTGLQYAYLLQVDPVLTVLEGGRGGRQPLDRGTVLVTFPERDVLEWYGEAAFPVPLGQVADAVERLRTGSLTLDPAVAIPLVRRYLDDLAAAGPGAAGHSPQQLIDWLTGFYPEVANRVELLAPVVGDGFRVVRVEEDDFLASRARGPSRSTASPACGPSWTTWRPCSRGPSRSTWPSTSGWPACPTSSGPISSTGTASRCPTWPRSCWTCWTGWSRRWSTTDPSCGAGCGACSAAASGGGAGCAT